MGASYTREITVLTERGKSVSYSACPIAVFTCNGTSVNVARRDTEITKGWNKPNRVGESGMYRWLGASLASTSTLAHCCCLHQASTITTHSWWGWLACLCFVSVFIYSHCPPRPLIKRARRKRKASGWQAGCGACITQGQVCCCERKRWIVGEVLLSLRKWQNETHFIHHVANHPTPVV